MSRYLLIAGIFVFLIGQFTGAQARIEEQDVLGVWLFDENQGELAQDASGHGHDGTITESSGEANWVPGQYGSALSLERGAHVEVPHTDEMNLTEFTIAAWVKVPGPLNPYQFVAGKESWPDRNYSMWILPGVMTFGYTTPGGANDLQAGSAEVADDEWHHVVGTFDGEQLVSYVDGIQRLQVAGAGEPATTTSSFKIGVQPPGESGPLTGAVDEVAIFVRALTEDEVVEVQEGLGIIFFGVEPSGKMPIAWARLKYAAGLSYP